VLNSCTLVVPLAEKRSFLELLHFVYTATFSTSGLDGDDRCEELLQLLSVANKYGVASMIRAVTEVWKGMLGDLELSDLQRAAFSPEIYSQYEDVQNLEDEARESLFQRFMNVATWNEPEFRSLAFESVDYLLTRDELEAQSEEEIFEQTLRWVQETYEAAEDRQAAMGELCSHLRFALMAGDFIHDRVMNAPEMATPPARQQMTEGLVYAASSQKRKDSQHDSRFQKRLGARFQIVLSGKLDEKGSQGESLVYESHGLKWQLCVRKETQTGTDTLGLFLSAAKSGKDRLATHSKHVDLRFSACRGGGSNWFCLHTLHNRNFGSSEVEWGTWDMFYGTRRWDEIMTRSWVDAVSKELTMKVEATVLE
jgi:hypothetical protein